MNTYARTSVIFSTLVFISLPSIAYAAVLINEVAWMGTSVSANDEWIELYNNGASTVTLDGWTLTDGAALSVALSDTLAAGSYAVLERTDDASAPGSAFLIYTGALSNDGRTLTLRDASGNIHDQVVGGESWESIGGDNATKETAQLTSGGWVTAAATPGSQNNSEAIATHNNEATENTAVTTSSRGSSKTSTSFDGSTLAISAPQRITGYVNNPVSFSATVRGVPEEHMRSLRYLWNFGDGMTSDKRNSEHRYRFPGTYAAVIEVSYAIKYFARQRVAVTILPFAVSLEIIDGNVLLHNNAEYEVDISGMKISDGTHVYVFPPNTILLPNATLILSPHVTGFGDVQFVTIFDGRSNAVAYAPDHNNTEDEHAGMGGISQAGGVIQSIAKQESISVARESQEQSLTQSASAFTAVPEDTKTDSS